MNTVSTAQDYKAMNLDEMQHHIDELPMLPQVLVRILQLNPNSEKYFEDVEKLATEDPALAIRVIALANSAASSPAEPIVSIHNAMTRMGTSAVTQMLAALAVQKVFIPTTPRQIAMWSHSVSTAIAGRTLARLIPELGVESEAAYVTGLLHDVGRFVMFEHAAPQLQAVDESNWATPEELIEADVAVFKYTHSELGYLACLHWGLPELLAQVIRTHHEPLPTSISRGSPDALNFVLQWADHISINLVDIAKEDLANRPLQSTLKACCPTGSCPADWIPKVSQQVEKMRQESADLLGNLGLITH